MYLFCWQLIWQGILEKRYRKGKLSPLHISSLDIRSMHQTREMRWNIWKFLSPRAIQPDWWTKKIATTRISDSYGGIKVGYFNSDIWSRGFCLRKVPHSAYLLQEGLTWEGKKGEIKSHVQSANETLNPVVASLHLKVSFLGVWNRLDFLRLPPLRSSSQFPDAFLCFFLCTSRFLNSAYPTFLEPGTVSIR